MKYLALLFSDLHLYIWPKFNKDNYRTKYYLSVLDKLFKKASRLNIPILFSGDLCHTPEGLSNTLLSMLLPFLLDLFNKYPNVHFYAISGNHDFEEVNSYYKRSPSYINTFANSIENFHIIDFDQHEFKKFAIFGIPYINFNEDYMDIIEKFKPIPGKCNILMNHNDYSKQQDVNGIIIGRGENISEEGFGKFDIVASGHVHKAEHLRNNIYSIGSPYQTRLTDLGGKFGYWLLTDNFKMKFKTIKGSPVYRLYKDPSEITNSFDCWIKQPREDEEIEKIAESAVDAEDRVQVLNYYFKMSGTKAKSKKLFLRNLIAQIDD